MKIKKIKRNTVLSINDIQDFSYDEIMEGFELPSGSESELSDLDSDSSEDLTYTELAPVKCFQSETGIDLKDVQQMSKSPLLETNDRSSICDIPTCSFQANEMNVDVTENGDSSLLNIGNMNRSNDDSEEEHEFEQLEREDDGSSESDSNEPLSEMKKRLDGIWEEKKKQSKLKDFTEPTGPILDDNVVTPCDHFLSVFPDTLFEHLVFQTNLFSTQAEKPFQPTNITEMKKFIAANIMMGITKKPSYKDYWSSNIQLRDEYISSFLPLKRFSWLLSHIHANDNHMMPRRGDDNYDKLYKIRPVLDTLSETFKSTYRPTRHQSVDESMVKFKGRSVLKQYVPLKPIKRGFKIWVRADEYGYVCQFQVYTGKIGSNPELNLGERVVTDLTRDLVGKNYFIYFDNFFSSIPLMVNLLNDGIYACGTIRSNRKGLPRKILNNSERGSSVALSSYKHEGLCFVQWQDKKPVQLISNCHDGTVLSTVTRKTRTRERIEVACPQIVKDYNKYMGAVDLSDMFKSYYAIDRKSRRWWLRLFWHFVDVSISNACILFNQRNSMEGPKMKIKDFRLRVVAGLIGAEMANPRGRKFHPIPRRCHKPFIPMELRTDKAAHMPVRTTKRRCAHCSSKVKQKRTCWMCTVCNLPLCLGGTEGENCFMRYHSF